MTGTGGDGIGVVRGQAGMEVKVDGDGWGMGMETKSAGRVGMSVISVPVQVSNHWPHSGFSFLCVWMMVTYPTLDRRRQHRPQTCRQSAVATVPVAAVPNTSNIRLSSRYNNTVTHHSISKPHYRNK